MDLLKLLHTYFPKELPPTFTTTSFATVMDSTRSNPFSQVPSKAMLIRHEIPRHGLKRRVIGIPNPVFHYHLCSDIVSNWTVIEAIYQGSSISRSSPTFNDNATDDDKDPVLNKLNTRALASYLLRTDISRCFPSIYTHSIPWAIHSKATAKANQNDKSILGNKLDSWVRRGQDNQTIGIPIGPYTSAIISEIVLCIIDADLQTRIPSLRGTRYVDDFELGFRACLLKES